MNLKLSGYFPVVCMMLSINILCGQEQKNTSKTPMTSYFKAGVEYLSNSVYNGRKDSSITPYYTPSIGFYDKSGFFISGSLSFLSSSTERRVDEFSIDLGYDFTVSDKLSGSIYANKSFYNPSSSTVRSSLKGSLGTYLSYDPGIVTFQGGIDATFSKSTDINVNVSLSHTFYFAEGEYWSFSPSVALNAGTQNFYQDYFQGRKRGSRNNLNTIVVKGYNSFHILDYELSFSLAYDTPKFNFFVKPVYAIPVNPVSISLNNGASYSIEKLGNSLYIETGIYCKF